LPGGQGSHFHHAFGSCSVSSGADAFKKGLGVYLNLGLAVNPPLCLRRIDLLRRRLVRRLLVRRLLVRRRRRGLLLRDLLFDIIIYNVKNLFVKN